tara:strand:- start:180757 stop:181683 length:927 start_codon:yes stop_codon:yes gene_type:complete
LYIGGGTPSLWGESGANFLENFLEKNKINLSDTCEATLEVNPGTWTSEGLKAFQKMGFNRFSLGVQSTENNFLEKIDRVHRKNEVLLTLKKFKELGVNFSVDFMLGLPFSKELNRNIIGELEEITSYEPDHISLYILTVKENYPFYKNLPDEDWIENEYLSVSEFLRDKGYEHYEVSNFCKPNKKSIHNSKYWQGDSIAALGPSATGYFSEAKKRYKWKTLSADFEIEQLSESSARMEKFYLGLRTLEGVDLVTFFEGTDLKIMLDLSREWSKKGLCEINKNRLFLTPRGYLIMDSLMDEVFIRVKSL